MIKDKIIGRPTRLNRQVLVPNGEYAEVVFLGDVHYGSPQCDVPRFLSMLDYCLQNKIYVFLMGDMIEMATRDSVGAGIYEQEEKAEDQFGEMIGFLKPLAEAKLILGFLSGNHEERVYKSVGIDIGKAMARELKIPYLGHACWSQFSVGTQKYSVYALHGTTASRFDGTVLKAVENVSYSFSADLVAMGHAHRAVNGFLVVESVVDNKVVEKKKFIVVTGSYVKYHDSYYEKSGGQISKLGSPKVKLFAAKHDISISW
jgi:UDP-2,3-diacylglucosamine pyrophosphatase LpxH